MELFIRYGRKMHEIETLMAEVEKLEQDPELARQREFNDKLMALIAEYGLSKQQALEIVCPNVLKQMKRSNQSSQKRAFKEKTYRNPATGETLTAKSVRHPILKSWVAQYGRETVNGWVVESAED